MATNQKDIMKAVVERSRKILAGDKIDLDEATAPRILERVTAVTLESLILETKKAAAESADGKATTSLKNLIDINFNNRESEEGEKDGNIMISFTPGPQAKLLAKQDDTSENEAD